MVSKAVACGVSVAALALGIGRPATATTNGRVFYLSVRVHQCLIGTTSPRAKHETVVPCSDAAHNLEVYAIGHGGWGHQTPPTNSFAIARALCLSAYQRTTGRPLPPTGGWQGFWPDPGAETKQYGDKVVCSYRSWPRFGPLGSGWHVH